MNIHKKNFIYIFTPYLHRKQVLIFQFLFISKHYVQLIRTILLGYVVLKNYLTVL